MFYLQMIALSHTIKTIALPSFSRHKLKLLSKCCVFKVRQYKFCCMKEFISFVELRQLFPYMAFVYAWIVPLWADQLLLQLLMKQFDTLPIQCRHIEHMHEGVWFRKK